MNREAIFHMPKTNYAYAYSENSINVRIRVKKDDFEKIEIVYGDKYDWKNNKTKKMTKILSDYVYDYYETNLKQETKRIIYFFKLYEDDKIYFYTEYGIQDNVNEDKETYFQFPFINKIDIHKKISWSDKAIFYQIFPDRFFNGNPEINHLNTEKWGTEPTYNNFMGGDLKGIIEKIPYLKELKINVLYLTPIFQSHSNHKYNIIDYYEIDKYFGTKEEFRRLVKELHKNDIKIVLDAVFNHSAVDFFAFKDVCKYGENSKYKDWFHIKKFPINLEKVIKRYKMAKSNENWYLDEEGNDILTYETFAFYPYMPKLNTENAEVKKYFIEVGKYWIKEFEIDGWRLDVSNEIDHEFWRAFRREIKSLNPNAFIIGEIWHNPEAWLRGDQFDSVMNYPLKNYIKDYIALGILDKEEFKYGINELLMRNTKQVNEMMLNFLSSHDISRYFSVCKENKVKLLLSYAFLFTFVGVPMIYYGDEIGLKGKGDPECRRCMEWNEQKWDNQIFEGLKRLIEIRKELKALQKGNFRWIEIDENLLSFIREYKNKKILVILNNSNEVKEIKNMNFEYDIMENKEITSDEEKIIIDKYGFKIFKIEGGN